MRRLLIFGLLSLVLADSRASSSAFAQGAGRVMVSRPDPPRLVVLLVVDQFRADYAELYGRQWTHGLARLFGSGAVFPLAAYPYAHTVTCPGHATIGTGTFPRTHGMIANSWYDPSLKRAALCTNDPAVTSVPFGGGPGAEHHSGRALQSPTLIDELRIQLPRLPRVVAMSLKPRAAIGLAGRGGPGTMVLWEEDNGTWATSDAYTKTPWPEIDEYIQAHPISVAYGQVWTRLLPENAYLFADDAPGENPPRPWKRTFPHVLESPTGKPDNTFVTSWETSPWSDAYLTDMAIALESKLRLGQDPGTDVLALSYSALDLVGHDFGPHSHEVQDVLARLDVSIGKLLDSFDHTVGAGKYVVAFAADHGVAPLPEQVAVLGVSAGRVSTAGLQQATQAILTKLLGEGAYYAGFAESNIYLTPGTFNVLRARPGAIDEVKAALLAVPGIAYVYGQDELASTAATDDDMLRASRLSYYPGRSGEFVVIPKPYWIMGGAGANHGSPYGYDRDVPLLFYGDGIKAGRYLESASPADIAPTLAALVGIKLAHTDGHVLVDALK